MANIPDILLLKLAKSGGSGGGSPVNAYKFKGSVASYYLLPSMGNEVGDIYDTQDTGMNYAWTGTDWDALGQIIDIQAIEDAIDEKQDKLSFDAVPTEGSTNPVTSDGIRRAIDAIAPEAHTIYGFHIDSTESDPSACVTYLADAIGMTPAFMDFANNRFNWGSWADAFFIPRPCMLNYDGTVAYYLDPSDYTKKLDGTASDITNDTFQGNAMIEWGKNGKKIWYKIVPDSGDDTSASVYIADYQADTDYRAWSFINNQGELVEHFYTPIYNGSLDGAGRLRSLSGVASTELCYNKTVNQEVAAAEMNNPGSDKLWYTEVYSDIVLIDLLLILMGKSLNTQEAFGTGRTGQSSRNISDVLTTGTMDGSGLFWGSANKNDGVKVFGMENWWGNHWRRYAGHLLVDYVHKYKLTRGTGDGSAASDYNATGADYLTGANSPQTSVYVGKMAFDSYAFMVKSGGGTSATYWCDYYDSGAATRYAARGGACNYGADAGAFQVFMGTPPTSGYWSIGAALSCKPKA